MIFEFLFYLFLAYMWGSFSEWFAHKYLMHSKFKGLEGIFEGHTAHHKAYNRHNFLANTFDKEDKAIYAGLALCLEHIMVFMLPVALVVLPFNPLLSLTFIGFGIFHYHLYNRVHPGMHLLHDTYPIPQWYMNMCTRIHFQHHQSPTKYFCVSLPGADWIMGTTCKMSWADKKDWLLVKAFNRFLTLPPKPDMEEIEKLNTCFLTKDLLKYMENGYVGPAPNAEMSKIGYVINTCILNLFVGKCEKITGFREELNHRPYIFACSHNSWADLFVFKQYFPGVRVMAAQKVMQFLGLGFFLGPFLGCFSVAPGRGVAVKSAVSVLNKGESLLVCPEGWAVFNRIIYPFKSGVSRIALESNTPVIPVYIDYQISRSDQFHTLWFPLQVVLDALDPLKPRQYTIIIGEPLPPNSSLADIEQAVRDLGGKER